MLASGSPRRNSLLNDLGIRPLVVPPRFDEASYHDLRKDPGELVATLARGKTTAVARDYPGDLILGADTIVVLGGVILGKPASPSEAVKMLGLLSGETHKVYTGIALYEPKSGRVFSDVDCTHVTMRRLEPGEIQWYVSTGEPMGKAGGYGIQGKAALFVTAINGDYTGVIGLPLAKFYEILRRAGVGITKLFI